MCLHVLQFVDKELDGRKEATSEQHEDVGVHVGEVGKPHEEEDAEEEDVEDLAAQGPMVVSSEAAARNERTQVASTAHSEADEYRGESFDARQECTKMSGAINPQKN